MSRPIPSTSKTWNWPANNEAPKRRGALAIRWSAKHAHV
jgi:hypothetical protein